MSEAPRKQRKKTILTDYRQPHPVSTVPMEGSKYPAQLMFDQALTGKIVLKVNDGVYKEGGKATHKEVEMDYAHRGALFEAILEATTNENFNTKQIAVQWKGFVFASGGGKLSENPILQVFLTVVRDKQGCIALHWTKGDYKPIFKFKGPKDTVVYVKNEAGERVEEPGVMSRWAARAWVNFHRPLLDRMEEESWAPPVPKENSNQNQKPARPSNNDAFEDDDVMF